MDKKIKKIAVEMFTAWGLISLSFALLDCHIWHLRLTPLITIHGYLSEGGSVALLSGIITLSTMPAFWIMILLSEYFPKTVLSLDPLIFEIIFAILALVFQVAIYYYLGNITGRFIVWVKNLLLKKQDTADI